MAGSEHHSIVDITYHESTFAFFLFCNGGSNQLRLQPRQPATECKTPQHENRRKIRQKSEKSNFGQFSIFSYSVFVCLFCSWPTQSQICVEIFVWNGFEYLRVCLLLLMALLVSKLGQAIASENVRGPSLLQELRESIVGKVLNIINRMVFICPTMRAMRFHLGVWKRNKCKFPFNPY